MKTRIPGLLAVIGTHQTTARATTISFATDPLVYSTDLSDNPSDLKILARLTNLTGRSGRDALATITASNFAILNGSSVPEPGTLALLGIGLAGMGLSRRRKAH